MSTLPLPEENTLASRVPVIEADPDDIAAILRFFGCGDLDGVDGASDRVVTLSEASDLDCPAHGRRLVPDACRSCRFLAGEVPPLPT